MPKAKITENSLLEMPVDYMMKHGLVTYFLMYFKEDFQITGKGGPRIRKIRRKRRALVNHIRDCRNHGELWDNLLREVVTFIFFSERGEEEDSLEGRDRWRVYFADWMIEDAVKEQVIVDYFLALGFGEKMIRETCFSLQNVGFWVQRSWDSNDNTVYRTTEGVRDDVRGEIDRHILGYPEFKRRKEEKNKARHAEMLAKMKKTKVPGHRP